MKNITIQEAVKIRNTANKFTLNNGFSAIIDFDKVAPVYNEVLIGGLYSDSEHIIEAIKRNAAAGFAGIKIERSVDGKRYIAVEVYETKEQLETAKEEE